MRGFVALVVFFLFALGAIYAAVWIIKPGAQQPAKVPQLAPDTSLNAKLQPERNQVHYAYLFSNCGYVFFGKVKGFVQHGDQGNYVDMLDPQNPATTRPVFAGPNVIVSPYLMSPK